MQHEVYVNLIQQKNEYCKMVYEIQGNIGEEAIAA